MAQDFVLTDLRFTVFSNLIDGEAAGDPKATVERLSAQITGMSAATIQKMPHPQGVQTVATCQWNGNELSVGFSPGRCDAIISPLMNAPTTGLDGPKLRGERSGLLALLSYIAHIVAPSIPSSSRVGVGSGAVAIMPDEKSAVAAFGETTGITDIGNVSDPFFRVNIKKVSEGIEFNQIVSTEVGKLSGFGMVGGNFTFKTSDYLRCMADFNTSTEIEELDIELTPRIIDQLIADLHSFAVDPASLAIRK